MEEVLATQQVGPSLELHFVAVTPAAGQKSQSHSHYLEGLECWEMCFDYPGQCL